MDHSKKDTYLFSLDALRVIAILAVILIHVTTKNIALLSQNVELAPLALFLNQTARFAVPLFFLISGFVLELNNKKGLSFISFFKKRASRIIAPFLFWSFAYYLLSNGLNVQKIISFDFLSNLIQGTTSYHLYFIPTLILFYLLFPILHTLLPFVMKPPVLLLIIGMQAFLLIQDYYFQELHLPYDIRIATLNIAVFVLGMAASHIKESLYKIVNKYVLFFVLITIILPIVIFFHVKFLTITQHTSHYLYNQYGPLNYLFTACLTSLLYWFFEKTHFLRNYFITLSKLSFFVFFIHVILITLIWDNYLNGFEYFRNTMTLRQFWFTPVMFAVISTASFGIAFFVHKIPFSSKITG